MQNSEMDYQVSENGESCHSADAQTHQNFQPDQSYFELVPCQETSEPVYGLLPPPTTPKKQEEKKATRKALSKRGGNVSKKAPPPRNHRCSFENCGKMFVRPAELARHMRKHTGERPFKCDECDMDFMRKDHLTSHKLKHKDEKQFKCPFCDYESNRGDTLKRHCNNKHKNETFNLRKQN